MYDVLIVGGGVIGCAIARELSRYQLKICLVEREEDVCTGTSKANSAIVHAGFDAKVGSKKAYFNVQGSRMMEALCQELDIPYDRCGSLVLSFDAADRPKLEDLVRRGQENGVEGLEVVEGEALRAMEPNLSTEAVAALYAPTGAIVCPFTLTYALAENAAATAPSSVLTPAWSAWSARRAVSPFTPTTACCTAAPWSTPPVSMPTSCTTSCVKTS